MKKILITAMSLNVGGAEKSLVNFLNMIDYSKYEIDLLLFQKKGAFLKQVPQNVNIIEIDEITVLFQSIKDTIKRFGLKYLFLSIKRYLYTFLEKTKYKQFDQIRIHRWLDFYYKLIPNNNIKYDLAISYAGGETAYYIIDKVKADRSVYFFHSDYSNIDIDVELEKYYVDKASTIVTISNACKISLIKKFNDIQNKVVVLQNLTSIEFLKKLASSYYPKEYKNFEDNIIVSVGRLHEIKGYDLAIESAELLKKHEIKFKWFVIGEGAERKKLEKMIKARNLENDFLLLGLRENPYPYIKNAKIVVQPSRFEGKSVVLDEAKMLGIPMVVTNYSSAKDQIIDGKTGIIAKMSPEGIAEKIEEILKDKNKYNEIKIELNNIDFSKENDIESYMNALIGG